MTFIECLAAGARVVASDIPAHRDLVEKTRGSISLVDLDVAPEILAREIAALSAAPAATPAIDSWDDVAERTLDAYRETIAAGSAR